MAINPNTGHTNQNACFVAMSGFGKSQALKAVLPERGVRCLLWDPDNDHAAWNTFYFDDRKKYARAVKRAIKSGQGFRLAFDGEVTVDNFEWWCSVVWAVLDGNLPMYVVVEELADVSPSAGKATPYWGQVNRKCRKYGGRLLWTTQKSQEVSKTAYDQAAIKYIGYPNDGSNLKRMAEMVDKKPEELKQLKPLEFYRREQTITEKVRFEYKKSGEMKRG